MPNEIQQQVQSQVFYSCSLTLGDGNCAFNAFSLGLCELILKNELELDSKDFYELVKINLKIESDAASFKFWLEEHPTNEERQQKLQGILREIAVKYIESNYDTTYKERYEGQLIAAYHDFKKTGAMDDTFMVHPHILGKFVEFRNLADKDLIAWWNSKALGAKKSPKEIYFSSMQQSARSPDDRERWGGAPELDALAMCFNINIRWKNEDGGENLGVQGGIVKNLTKEEANLLRDLDLGDYLGQDFIIRNFCNKETLETLMAPVALSEQQREELKHIINSSVNCKINLSNLIGNVKFEEIKDILKKRGIITHKGEIPADNQDVRTRILNRINGVTNTQLSQQVLQAFKYNPLKFGVRHNGLHWSYLRLETLNNKKTDLKPLPFYHSNFEKQRKFSNSDVRNISFLNHNNKTNNRQSPVPVIESLYLQSTSHQKQAYFRYLLHYQHYNADFTKKENKRLHYPFSLCAEQELPGYIRTEHNRLFEVLEPYIAHCLKSIFENLFLVKEGFSFQDSLNLTSNSAISVLKTFYSKTHKLTKGYNIQGKDAKNVEVVNCSLQHLDSTVKKIKIDNNQKKYCSSFLFLLEVPGIDCLISWGVLWGRQNALRCIPLKTLFDKKVYSLLNKCGAVPDRLAVNRFLTTQLFNEKDKFNVNLQRMQINCANNINKGKTVAKTEEWSNQISELRNYRLIDDQGHVIYRDAIVMWQDIFFAKNRAAEAFAVPFLLSQVKPWLSEEATIVEWAKAYQNLCEILILCFDCFPESNLKENFESIMVKIIDPYNRFNKKPFALYPYAMTAIFDVFYQVLNRDKFRNQQPLVSYISQNYFESLDLMQELDEQGRIKASKVDALHEIKEMPDILLADIHPNNAARKWLFENDIASWIIEKLKTDDKRKMILVLDITLNNLSDSILQKILHDLEPYVKNQQLEIFGIQSLAKLIQLGADNFSGGCCFHVTEDVKQTFNFPICNLPQKVSFFGFLQQNFQHIIARYFLRVRENTDWMYKKLKDRFSNIEENVFIEIEGEERTRAQFCATSVTTNVDENTVYVAIEFESFFEKIKRFDKEEKEKLVKKFRDLMLKLAELRELPITGRQSFGFSLSNMSTAVHAIRFSIGVENRELLIQYANMITDFSFALSRYTAFVLSKHRNNYSREFYIDYFKDKMIEIYQILKSGTSKSFEVEQLSEDVDEYGHESDISIGKVSIFFKDYRLSLKGIKDTFEPKIEGFIGYDSSFHVFNLFFSLIFIGSHSVSVREDVVQIFRDFPFLFTENESQIEDEKSKVSIVFEPTFQLTFKDRNYGSNNTFVIVPKFGTIAVSLSKLNKLERSEIFDEFYHYYLETTPYEREPNSILVRIKIDERKPHADYLEDIVGHFKIKSLAGVIDYLNGLNLKNLPLLEKQSWRSYSETPLDCLQKILRSFGGLMIVKRRNGINILDILRINDFTLKSSVMSGIYEQLENGALSRKKLSREIAEDISKIFNEREIKEYIGHSCDFYGWILKLEENIENNKENLEFLKNYFIATMPLFRYICYFPMRQLLSISVHHSDLKEYVQSLEADVLEQADQVWEIGCDLRLMSSETLGCHDAIMQKREIAVIKNKDDFEILYKNKGCNLRLMQNGIGNFENEIKERNEIIIANNNGEFIIFYKNKINTEIGNFNCSKNKNLKELLLTLAFDGELFVKDQKSEELYKLIYEIVTSEGGCIKNEENNHIARFKCNETLKKEFIALNIDAENLPKLLIRDGSTERIYELVYREVKSRKGYTGQTSQTNRKINYYLRLYVRYPLSDIYKQQLLSKIKEKPKVFLIDWIGAPDFYYYPLDYFTINLIGLDDHDHPYYQEELILGEKNQLAIQEFFVGIGCKEILLEHLSNREGLKFLVSAIRWLIITKDLELCEGISKFLGLANLASSFDKEIVNNLKKYIPNLAKDGIMKQDQLNYMQSLIADAEKKIAISKLKSLVKLFMNIYAEGDREIVKKLFEKISNLLNVEELSKDARLINEVRKHLGVIKSLLNNKADMNANTLDFAKIGEIQKESKEIIVILTEWDTRVEIWGGKCLTYLLSQAQANLTCQNNFYKANQEQLSKARNSAASQVQSVPNVFITPMIQSLTEKKFSSPNDQSWKTEAARGGKGSEATRSGRESEATRGSSRRSETTRGGRIRNYAKW